MGVMRFTQPAQLHDGARVEDFCSGQLVVDEWFVGRAKKAKARGSAVVYVTYRAGADMTAESPAGFYTLSSASVDRESIAGGWLKRNAPQHVPVILLGMLGVDRRYQESGLGRMLLRDAAARAFAIADALGAKALVVDPIDEKAAAFYEACGFEPIPGLGRMYVPLRRKGSLESA